MSRKYKASWETHTDGNGDKIGVWCSKKTDSSGHCVWCTSNINVENSGDNALKRHATTSIHKKNKLRVQGDSHLKQMKIEKLVHPMRNIDKSVKTAETLWSLFVAEHNLSFALANHASELFAKMFPDSEIAEKFSCRKTKTNYLISDGISINFHEELITKLRNSVFSLMIDESNKQYGRKYLHMLVKFYDNALSEAIPEFLASVVVNKATSANLVSAIVDQFRADGLSFDNLVQVMSDSPAVMRGEMNGVITVLKRDHAKHLIDINGCSLHTISNAAKTALPKLDCYEQIEEFAQDISSFIKNHVSLIDEFRDLQDLMNIEKHQLLRFVEVRFLSMLPVVDRLIEQYPALSKFFIDVIPKDHPKLLKKPQVTRIVNMLKKKRTLMSLHFISFALSKFQMYEKLFQRKDPTIHLLYDEQINLLRDVLISFCSFDKVQKLKTARELLEFQFKEERNQMTNSEMHMGTYCKRELSTMTEQDQKHFKTGVKLFYSTLASYLKLNLPLNNSDLAALRCLNPQKRHETSPESIIALANKLPPGCGLEVPLLPKCADDLTKEWQSYQLEDISEKSIMERNDKGELTYRRIDKFWSEIFEKRDSNGDEKYPIISIVVPALLSIVEANGEVERSFKDLKDIITDDRNSLGEYTVNGLMTTKSHLRATLSDCYSYPVSSALLERVGKARGHYEERQKLQQEAENRSQREKQNKQIQEELLKKLQETNNERNRVKAIADSEKAVGEQQAEAVKMKNEAIELLQAAQQMINESEKIAKKAEKGKSEIEKVKEKYAKKSLSEMVRKTASQIQTAMLLSSREKPISHLGEKPACNRDGEKPSCSRDGGNSAQSQEREESVQNGEKLTRKNPTANLASGSGTAGGKVGLKRSADVSSSNMLNNFLIKYPKRN